MIKESDKTIAETPLTAAELAPCQMCLGLASRKTARTITRAFERRLRSTGVRSTQFSVLATLILAGPLPIGRLAEWLGLERTTLSRNLDLIEAKGWVSIEAAEDDARSSTVTITPSGREMARKALPAWHAAQNAVLAALGQAGFESLHALAETRID